MAKADLTRDYYGDLDLQPGASEIDIKKQFKKLALKYHPDRNPGREAEVNSKFQTIQSAHEVLTDPEQRVKYDSMRLRGNRGSAYNAYSSTASRASGTKGNPWSNAGAEWAPPPKAPQSRKAPTSAGASRYAGFQTPKPGASTSTKDDAEARRKRYEAWESMRGQQKQYTPKPVPKESVPRSGREESNGYRYPPPPKPRPGFDEFKAGTSPTRKKNGFMPGTPGGDEPPAANTSSYYTQRPSRPEASPRAPPPGIPTVPVDPLAKFRERAKYQPPLEPRLSTPYSTTGGERTNPFESINRSRSQRESNDYATADYDHSPKRPAPQTSRTSQGTAGASTSQKPHKSPTVDIDTSSSDDESPLDSGNPSFGTRPRVYAKRRTARRTAQEAPPTPANKPVWPESKGADGKPCKPTLDGFRRFWAAEEAKKEEQDILNHTKADATNNDKDATNKTPSIFSFNAEQTAPSPHKMYSHSAENISTTFSPNDWHGKFQAGDYFGGNSTSGVPRGRSSSRTAPKSPIKRRPLNRPRMSTSTHNSGSEADGQNPKFGTESSSSSGGTTFSPEEWAQTFKPQTFAPPVYPSPGIQSRNQSFSRGSSRRTRVGTPKPTTASKTAGTAAIVDDESSDDVKPLFSERPSSKGESTAAEDPVVPDISPQPMDIDPPVEPVSMPPNSQARNVPLEPSKPEWRAGDAKSATEQASLPPKNAEAEAEAGQEAKSTRRNTKSTDSEDFKTTLEDLKNIEPLHNPATGLNSFSDLTSDLPFPSKPALNVPISRNFSSGQLELPHPPKAPLMPAIPTTAKRPSQSSFQSYVLAFKAYMAEWDVFNTRILIHFVARKNQVDAMPPGWLEAFGESNYERYMEGLREDEKIRGWWDVACGKHQTAIADFKWLRDVMKGGIDAASANTNQL